MRYSFTGRFFSQRLFQLKTYIAGFLIFCVCAPLLSPGRGASAQGGCNVECAATVPSTSQINEPVSFMATATASGCASAPIYEWDFGDGTPVASQQNVTHTYAAPGSYTWKLTTTANVGAPMINTIAGGYGDNAPARQAPFTTPSAIARDPQGRGVYVIDEAGASLIRFINTSNAPATIAGRVIAPGAVRVIAGGGGDEQSENAPALQAFIRAVGLGVSADGNLLFFNDEGAARIRVVNVSSNLVMIGTNMIGAGNIRTFTSFGPSDPLAAGYISGFAVHPMTGELYFTDSGPGVNKVFKVSANGVSVTAVAGNGAATTPQDALPPPPVNATNVPLLLPRDIVFNGAGDLYIADTGHARVVKVDAAGKITLALQYDLSQPDVDPYPAGLAVIGDAVYVANGNQQTIVNVAGTGTIVAGKENMACDYSSSSCGDGGAGVNATFGLAGSLAMPALPGIESNATGLFILDQGPNQRGRVRYLNLSGAPVTLAGVTIAPNNINTIAGSGLASLDGGAAIGAPLSALAGVAIDANKNLFIADTLVGRLRFVNRGSNPVTLFPNTPAQQTAGPGSIITINKDGAAGQIDGVPVNQAGFDTPQGLFVTNQGVFVADSKGGPTVSLKRNGAIRFINTSPATVILYPGSPKAISVPPGNIAKIVGGGVDTSIGNGGFALDARLLAPSDVVVNPAGDIYIADTGNRDVRKVSGATGIVTSLNLPVSRYTGLALDASGRLYIADFSRDLVLRESSAGSGEFARLNPELMPLNMPRDVAVDAGGAVYVTNSGENRIVRISPAGVVEPFAGTTGGFDGDGGLAADAKINISPAPIKYGSFGSPEEIPPTVNIAAGPGGEVIFTDSVNSRVRRIASAVVTCVKTGTITITNNNPLPALTSINPDNKLVNSAAFTLTVNGSGFISSSVVRWNGQNRTTTFVSATQLTASIPASDLTSAGAAQVTVFNPAPGGGSSNAVAFNVTACPQPVPALSGIIPNSILAGFGAFALTVNGSGFDQNSKVRWNDQELQTTFGGATQLAAQVPANLVASAGTAQVTVFRPAPGCGVSAAQTFTIAASQGAPEPVITMLRPTAVGAGSAGLTLTVFGNFFISGSVARINGFTRATTFGSSTRLNVTVPAGDIANAGDLSISVVNPSPPPGGTTGTMVLKVAPKVSSANAASFTSAQLTPGSIVAGFGAGLATGTAFASAIPLPTTLLGTTVKVTDSAGTERPAGLFYVSAGQLNFHAPPETVDGVATVVVAVNSNIVAAGPMTITRVAPGLFTASATGAGVAAAVVLRVRNGAQTFEPAVRIEGGGFAPVPINLGPSGDVVYAVLYGTGIRNRTSVGNVSVTFTGSCGTVTKSLSAALSEAAVASGFVGVDQVNLVLPRTLIGCGVVDAKLTVDGKVTNTVKLAIQ